MRLSRQSPLKIDRFRGPDDLKQITEMMLDVKAALFNAVRFNAPLGVLRFLIDEQGADVNDVDEYGTSPLMDACILGHSEVVLLLIRRGADVNICDVRGLTALMCACIHGGESGRAIVLSLLKAGANVDRVTFHGMHGMHRTAFTCLHQHDHMRDAIIGVMFAKSKHWALVDK